MNFQELLSKMVELDQPVPEAVETPAEEIAVEETPVLDTAVVEEPVVEEPVTECPPEMGAPAPAEHTNPPTMSVNLNAQGLDEIGELMKLIAKVNPDMEEPKPTATITSLAAPANDRPELPPLKMLPDLDAEQGPEDNKEEPEEKEEAFGNSEQGDAGPDVKDTEYMINKLAGGMNRPKGQFKHSYKAGDNPMAMPEGDLRAAIRAELLQRLAEAKGAK